ncbi:unnamed protein product, partial [Cylicostephanus goldi]
TYQRNGYGDRGGFDRRGGRRGRGRGGYRNGGSQNGGSANGSSSNVGKPWRGDGARYSDEEWSGTEEAKHRDDQTEDQERRQGRLRGGGSGGSGERGGSAGRRRGTLWRGSFRLLFCPIKLHDNKLHLVVPPEFAKPLLLM